MRNSANVDRQLSKNVDNISSCEQIMSMEKKAVSCNHSEPPVSSTICETILNNQNVMLQNQRKIMLQLANFRVNFGKTARKTDQPKKLRKTFANRPVCPVRLNLIDSLEELVELEDKLNNRNTFVALTKQLAVVCDRKGNGIDYCYMLVDKFFTRKFMVQCSWAGGSRDGTDKIPFKIYQNVIELFFTIVSQADRHFTLEKCESFFKIVMRNAVRRSESSLTRLSRSKKRPKKLVYNKDKLKFMKDNIGSVLQNFRENKEGNSLDENTVMAVDKIEIDDFYTNDTQ